MVDLVKLIFKDFGLRVVYFLIALLLLDAAGQLKIILI